MLRNMTLALLALAVVASTTQAGLVASTEKRVNPGDASAPYNAFAANAFTTDTAYNAGGLATTWVSYALGLTPTAGTKISALEITITTPASPLSGFNQRYTFDSDLEVFVPTPSSTNVSNGDSHLIVGGSQVFVAPNENNNVPGGPATAADTAASDYGVGTLLNGLWGFDAGQQAAQVDGTTVRFAYLVIPRGSQPTVVITANAATTAPGGGPGPDFVFKSTDFPEFGIPEPASMSLVGLALVGFGFIRRR